MIALMEKYRPLPKSEAQVDLFRERDSYQHQPHPLYAWQTNHLEDGGWNRWTCQQARVHWLEGDHLTILKPPAVANLAQSIRQAMDLPRNARGKA
jgi:thioesterase domain-containing protein